MRNRSRFRLTIGKKLIALMGVSLALTALSVVYLSTNIFVKSTTAIIQTHNIDLATGLSRKVHDSLEALIEKMRVVGILMAKSSGDREAVVREIFASDKEFLLFALVELGRASILKSPQTAVSAELSRLGDERGERAFSRLRAEASFSWEQLERGEAQLSNFKLADGTWAVAIGTPFVRKTANGSGFSHAVVVILKQAHFATAFSASDAVTTYLIDRHGNLMAHADSSLAALGESLAHLRIVQECSQGKVPHGQIRYEDPETREAKLGAFSLVGFAGLGVVAEVPEAKAYEDAWRARYQSFLVALLVLSLAFLVSYLYSESLTWPIKQLVAAADRVKEGDFKISLKPKTRDEIAELSLAFNDMARGLEERDRVKATFTKFHNREIAEKLLSGDVKLGGERREANILFADIRGFTAMSEVMEPEAVVEMLNEYMTCMVAILRKHGGLVDKYVGDAIMVLWGIPLDRVTDTDNAVQACLDMRLALNELNQKRLARGLAAIHIGMGLNRGQVVAGNFGSNERMEYTVIGDSVNVASRIESMTKEYGTDLLVADAIYQEVKHRFLFEECARAKVKGKAKPLILYKVLGYRSQKGEPVLVQTPYSTYSASEVSADAAKFVA